MDDMIPVSAAALALGCSRERVVRLVQRQVLAGRLVAGRYVVERPALDRLLGERQSQDAAPAKAS